MEEENHVAVPNLTTAATILAVAGKSAGGRLVVAIGLTIAVTTLAVEGNSVMEAGSPVAVPKHTTPVTTLAVEGK